MFVDRIISIFFSRFSSHKLMIQTIDRIANEPPIDANAPKNLQEKILDLQLVAIK